MNSLYWMFLLYFALPAASGAAAHRSANSSTLSQALARIGSADAMEKLAASIIATIVFLAILTGHIASGGPKPMLLIIFTTLELFLLTGCLFYLRFKDPIDCYESTRPVKLAFTFITLTVVWLSNVYADLIIIDFTRINPSDIASAKAAVVTIVTIFLSALAVSLLALIPYAILALALDHFSARKRKPEIANMWLGLRGLIPEESRKKPSIFVNGVLVIGLGFSAVIPLTILDYTVKDPAFEPFVRKLIVFASFHMQESECAGPQPDGSRFALLSDDRLGIAIPDKAKGFVFNVVKCPKGNASGRLKIEPKVTVSLPTSLYSL